jgi:Zn-dependent M16 (insulinase) family peptidase
MQQAKAAGQGPVRADFEDMFLFDGQRQLKIRFNPKVTSFKNTIPEQKIETIGSKYPFIFRNGHTNYKEFPIGGLISYTADDSALFLFDKELEDSHILDEQQVRKRSNPYGFTAVYDDDGKILKSLNYTGT